MGNPDFQGIIHEDQITKLVLVFHGDGLQNPEKKEIGSLGMRRMSLA